MKGLPVVLAASGLMSTPGIIAAQLKMFSKYVMIWCSTR